MVSEALESAKLLKENGISAGVINMHTIKPIDIECLDILFRRSKLIVTVEEHSVIGGLGSAIAEYKANKVASPPQLIIGLPDRFDSAGDYQYLLEKHGLVSNKIVATVLDFAKINHLNIYD